MGGPGSGPKGGIGGMGRGHQSKKGGGKSSAGRRTDFGKKNFTVSQKRFTPPGGRGR